jgi:hypothetical protein
MYVRYLVLKIDLVQPCHSQNPSTLDSTSAPRSLVHPRARLVVQAPHLLVTLTGSPVSPRSSAIRPRRVLRLARNLTSGPSTQNFHPVVAHLQLTANPPLLSTRCQPAAQQHIFSSCTGRSTLFPTISTLPTPRPPTFTTRHLSSRRLSSNPSWRPRRIQNRVYMENTAIPQLPARSRVAVPRIPTPMV